MRMVTKKTALLIAIFLCAAGPARADRCVAWTDKAFPVTMEACSYESGGSGYYKITNAGEKDAAVCWSVISNSGKRDKGCNLNLAARKSTSGSCFQCGTKNEGVKAIQLDSYKPRP